MNKDRSFFAPYPAYLGSSVGDSSGIELCTYSFQRPSLKVLTGSILPPYQNLASRCSQLSISKIGYKSRDDVALS